MDKERAGIQSVEVGFLHAGGADALARAAHAARPGGRSAGMSAAKAHRYLVSFQRLGLVVQDAAPHTTTWARPRSSWGWPRCRGWMRCAGARAHACTDGEIGHTLALAVWGNHGPTIVHWEESPQAVTANLRLGDVMPLLSSATGRCFAAHMPRDAVAPMLQDELARAAEAGRTDVPTTMAEVIPCWTEVRTRGAARVVDTLLPGIVAFCAPVFDADGHLVLGITTLGSVATFDPAWGGAIAPPGAGRCPALARPGRGLRLTPAGAPVMPRRPLLVLTLLVLALHWLVLQGMPLDWDGTPSAAPAAPVFSTRNIAPPPPRPVVAQASPAPARPAAARKKPAPQPRTTPPKAKAAATAPPPEPQAQAQSPVETGESPHHRLRRKTTRERPLRGNRRDRSDSASRGGGHSPAAPGQCGSATIPQPRKPRPCHGPRHSPGQRHGRRRGHQPARWRHGPHGQHSRARRAPARAGAPDV
jgi:DNA-binding IclR family transcriptional regulator